MHLLSAFAFLFFTIGSLICSDSEDTWPLGSSLSSMYAEQFVSEIEDNSADKSESEKTDAPSMQQLAAEIDSLTTSYREVARLHHTTQSLLMQFHNNHESPLFKTSDIHAFNDDSIEGAKKRKRGRDAGYVAFRKKKRSVTFTLPEDEPLIESMEQYAIIGREIAKICDLSKQKQSFDAAAWDQQSEALMSCMNGMRSHLQKTFSPAQPKPGNPPSLHQQSDPHLIALFTKAQQKIGEQL